MIIILSHLACFIFPLTSFGLLITGPHTILAALAWTIPFWIVLLLDWKGPKFKPESLEPIVDDDTSHRLYHWLMFILALLQFVNIGLLFVYVSQMTWDSTSAVLTGVINLLVLRFLLGVSSSTAGVVAHELLHRPQVWLQSLGRLLLCTLCFEHFTITHLRGHHAEPNSSDDIAGARLGESFQHYWQRVAPGHLRYVWQSELERLHINGLDWKNLRILKHQMLHGALIELAIVILGGYWFGWLAAVVFLYQALAAVRIIEAVNYIQHWGLQEGDFGNSYGWVCDSWITKYCFISLSHHIGHHRDGSVPFYEIPYSNQGPLMPYGYFVMNLWAKLDNVSYQQMALQQLEQFRLQQASN